MGKPKNPKVDWQMVPGFLDEVSNYVQTGLHPDGVVVENIESACWLNEIQNLSQI